MDKCRVLSVVNQCGAGAGYQVRGTVRRKCQPHRSSPLSGPTPQAQVQPGARPHGPPKPLGHSSLLVPAPVGTDLQEGTKKDFIHWKKLKFDADPAEKGWA